MDGNGAITFVVSTRISYRVCQTVLRDSQNLEFFSQEHGDEIPIGDHQEGHTIIRQVRDENGDQYEIHQQVQGHPDDMGQVQMEVQNDQMGDHGTKLERIEDDPYAFDDGKIYQLSANATKKHLPL